MVVIPVISTSFLSGCFMQLVSNPKVNHQEPLSLQFVCNQGNHSLWLKQVTDMYDYCSSQYCSWVVPWTKSFILNNYINKHPG